VRSLHSVRRSHRSAPVKEDKSKTAGAGATTWARAPTPRSTDTSQSPFASPVPRSRARSGFSNMLISSPLSPHAASNGTKNLYRPLLSRKQFHKRIAKRSEITLASSKEHLYAQQPRGLFRKSGRKGARNSANYVRSIFPMAISATAIAGLLYLHLASRIGSLYIQLALGKLPVGAWRRPNASPSNTASALHGASSAT
jgi:hypothetical protein